MLRQNYYRYYREGQANGFAHALRYVVGSEGYAQLLKRGVDPLTASNAEIAASSMLAFKYDANQRVAEEKIRGGRETYSYTYESNPNPPLTTNYNIWTRKTTETLPDGNRRTVYTNSKGTTILSKLEEIATGKKWFEYLQYNGDGRVTISAKPSAIESVTEPTPGNTNLTVTLKQHDGLVYLNEYYAATDPAQGHVATYQKKLSVKQGNQGALLPMRSATYRTHTVNGVSIHPFASNTVYPETNQPATTFYDCAYYADDGSATGFGNIPVTHNPANQTSGDTIFEQTTTGYNEVGEVILTATFKRFHDATGFGPLNGPNDAQPKARRSYTANYFDPIGRSLATADFGTQGGATLSRPDSIPERSDLVLVTSTRYGKDGQGNATIDPNGIETRWKNDAAGRQIRLLEGIDPCCSNEAQSTKNKEQINPCAEAPRITEFAYGPDGQMTRLTLINDETGNQVTRWVYGTTLEDSLVARSDLLRAKIYPESDDETEPLGDGLDGVYNRIEYTYNIQADIATMKDANETVHAYDFDLLGRQTQDRITTFGAEIDQAVKRIATEYEVRGMAAKVTSFDDATVGSGNVLNEIGYVYDDFGQLIKDSQAHSGSVGATTPAVSYTYENGSTGNTTRRTSTVYPNGRVVETGYGAAGSDSDRLGQTVSLKIQGEAQNAVDYTYVGLDWPVRVLYPEPAVNLTYIKTASHPLGDAGDQYTDFDRFGRTVDMRWSTTANGAIRDRFQWGYDRAGNRTWKATLAATSGGQDEKYEHDTLYQVTDFARGTLNINRSAIGAIPANEQTWTYDPTGNWDRYTTADDGTETLDQTRVHNQDNQITQIDGSNSGILYDRAGNATQMPPDKDGDWSKFYRLKWDGWNRLVEVKDKGNALVVTYAYDGRTRRTAKTISGATTHSYYNEEWRPVEERVDAGTSAERQYLWGNRYRDDLALRDRDTNESGSLDERLYVTHDYFNPTAILDTVGNVQERYGYSAFGIRRIMAADFSVRATSSFDWSFGFQGQFFDLEIGYYNYGFRYYVAQLGWINRDPLQNESDPNLYSFVKNSPISMVDLVGLTGTSTSWKTYGPSADAYGVVPIYVTLGFTSPYLIGGAAGASIEIVFNCRDFTSHKFATALFAIGFANPGVSLTAGQQLNFIFNLATASDYAGLFVGLSASVTPFVGVSGSAFTTPAGAENLFRTGGFGGETYGYGAGPSFGVPGISIAVQLERFWDLGAYSGLSISDWHSICCKRGGSSSSAGSGLDQTKRDEVVALALAASETAKADVKHRLKNDFNWAFLRSRAVRAVDEARWKELR